LSGNENAIELLKERIECEKNLNNEEYKKLSKINWKKLSGNINAIEQLKERIEYEKTLTKKEYENLEENSKIDWFNLSQNVNAIELLKANKDKIDWRFLVNLLEK
jgi:outer membrane PBP1 activator LpoA protein